MQHSSTSLHVVQKGRARPSSLHEGVLILSTTVISFDILHYYVPTDSWPVLLSKSIEIYKKRVKHLSRLIVY